MRIAGVENLQYTNTLRIINFMFQQKFWRENKRIKPEYQCAIPERASSACGQRHGGIPQQRPTVDCELDSVGSQYMGPG